MESSLAPLVYLGGVDSRTVVRSGGGHGSAADDPNVLASLLEDALDRQTPEDRLRNSTLGVSDSLAELELRRGRTVHLAGPRTSEMALRLHAIPSLARLRWLLPHGSLAVRRCEGFIKPSRLVSRLGWRLFGLLEAVGLGFLVFPDEVVATYPDIELGVLGSLLDGLLGDEVAGWVLYCGEPGPRGKITVKVWDHQGKDRAYVKIGRGALGQNAVKVERLALEYVNTLRLSTMIVPNVVATGIVPATGDQFLATAPVPGKVDPRLSPTPIHTRALNELAAGARPHVCSYSDWLDRSTRILSGDIRSAVAPDFGPSVEWLKVTQKAIAAVVEGEQVGLTPSHGDFSPWNVAVSGDSLSVFDWERWDRRPPYWDLFFFLFQFEVGVAGRSPSRALARLTGENGPYASLISSCETTQGWGLDRRLRWLIFLLDATVTYLYQVGEARLYGRPDTGVLHFARAGVEMLRIESHRTGSDERNAQL